jgi:catechol 2,3-dioxygenase-like lactoylglutathione lyase family enzyme
MAKLGVANRQALRHWFRVPNESALSVQTPTANTSFGLGQIARTVRDIQKSESWYRDVVGLPHLFTFGKLAFFDCAGVRLYLTQPDGEPAPESILYFSVANIQEAHDTLRGRGVEFSNAPHMIHRHADGTEEWMAFFKDLEGRPLAIMSKVKPPG